MTSNDMNDQATFRLLFVCTGNTCRSPMAQAIAERSLRRRGWDGVEIRSAGVSAAPGGEASEGARVAAESGGLSLEAHRATSLDTEVVAWASLILTMGPHHVDAVEALEGCGKVWMLSDFPGGGDNPGGLGVPDPFGGDAQAYRECLETLEGLVEAALGRVDTDFLNPEKRGRSVGLPTAQTRVFAIMGDPVEHSLSPVIQNAAFGRPGSTGCTWRFTAMPNGWSASWRGSRGPGAEGTSRFPTRKRPLPFSTKRPRRSVGRGRVTRFGARTESSVETTPTSRASGGRCAIFSVVARLATGCSCSGQEARRVRHYSAW